MNAYKVYVKTDAEGRIISVNSDAFLSSFDGWQYIDSGSGDKYHHAQANYFNTLLDDRGLFIYKLVDGKPQRRTEEEINADFKPQETATQEDRIAALEEALNLLIEGATVNDA